MDSDFNPYEQWLGIPETELPPNHYRLLGLRDFENDTLKIEKRALTLFDKIQDIAAGTSQIAATQKLLNEISTARVTLLNDEKRAQYESQLRGELGHSGLDALSEFGSVSNGRLSFDDFAPVPLDDNFVPPILMQAAKSKKSVPKKPKKRSPLGLVLSLCFVVFLATGIGVGFIASRMPEGGFLRDLEADADAGIQVEPEVLSESETPRELTAFELAEQLDREQQKQFEAKKATSTGQAEKDKTQEGDVAKQEFHEDLSTMKPGDLASHPFESSIGTWTAKGKVYKGPREENASPKRINVRPGQIGEVSLKLVTEVVGSSTMRIKVQRVTPQNKKFDLKIFAVSEGSQKRLEALGKLSVGKLSTLRFQLPPQTTEIKIVCDSAPSIDPAKPWQGGINIREIWFKSANLNR